MGEAKRRGTFEERKDQAISQGRIKKHKPPKNPQSSLQQIFGQVMMGALLDGYISHSKRRPPR